MGPCHSSKRGLSTKNFQNKPIIIAPTEKDAEKINLGHNDVSVLIQNSQLNNISDEKQINEKLDYLLSSEMSFRLRSGASISNILQQKIHSEDLTEYMMIELGLRIYKRIKEQESCLKEYHRYIAHIKQLLDIISTLLEQHFVRLETDRPISWSNKNFPFIFLTNTVVLFHALISHKHLLLVKPEDRWWTKNKNEENFQSLLSLIIEIAGKIKYEYEPKFKYQPKNSMMMNSKVYSINSYEEQMQKSMNSNESKSDRAKKESDSFFLGVSPHFNDKVMKEEEKNNVVIFKKNKSSEDIAAKYKTQDEIREDSSDNDVINENFSDNHRAKDCQKYLFTLSPKAKKSIKKP